jgi:hypothetical protein
MTSPNDVKRESFWGLNRWSFPGCHRRLRCPSFCQLKCRYQKQQRGTDQQPCASDEFSFHSKTILFERAGIFSTLGGGQWNKLAACSTDLAERTQRTAGS